MLTLYSPSLYTVSEVDMMGDLIIYISLFVGLLAGLGFLFKLYLQASRGVCISSTDLTGKTVIITGPTAGNLYIEYLELFVMSRLEYTSVCNSYL